MLSLRCFRTSSSVRAPRFRPLRLLLAIVFANAVQLVPAAEFIPLGTLLEADTSWARSISDDGSVVTGHVNGNINGDVSPGKQLQVFRWTEAGGMVGLGTLPGYDESQQYSGQQVSGDGFTIVGSASGDDLPQKGFIYSEANGMRPLDHTSWPHAVSYDGSVVVGRGVAGAFRWTEASGAVSLGFAPGDTGSRAYGVSADGSVIVGDSWGGPNGDGGFIWTASTGSQRLGFNPTSTTSISSDGMVVGGDARLSSASNREAFRWTAENGALGLGWLPGTANDDGVNFSSIRGINTDGSLMVGFSGFDLDRRRGFLWSQQDGLQDLQQLLVEQYDLGSSLEGWRLRAPQDISADGQFIVGIGFNPSGANEGWLVRLDAPIPEPGSLTLLILGAIPLLPHRRGRCRACAVLV